MKTLILVIFATFTASAYSDHHESAPMSTDGAFTTLQVAAPDIAKYRQTLIDTLQPLKQRVQLLLAFVSRIAGKTTWVK